MNNERNIQLVTSYLDGHLPDKERKNFEQRLKEDEELREQFELEKFIRTGVEYSVIKNAREELEILEENISLTEKRSDGKIIPLRRWLGIAAALVLLALAVGFIVFTMNQPDPGELFAEYFEPYPNLFYQGQRSEEAESEVVKAFRHYDEGDYKMAISKFDELLTKKYDPAVQFYLGVAYLANDEADMSVNTLEKFIDKNEDMQQEAKWYLALAFLKKGDRERVRDILSKIAKEEPERLEVEKLLEQLE